MGALTLKSFPHESRGWEIKNFDCVDPTDSYGSETQVYVNRRKILIIEPGFDFFLSNSWLSDKSRHVFDGAYKVNVKVEDRSSFVSKNLYLKILQKFYFLEHFFTPAQVTNYLTIVFGHVGLETISLLNSFALRYSFINIKSTDGSNSSTDFETDFQLNAVASWSKLQFVDTCLLIGTNSRFESFRLNILLRKRIMKGGFSCLSFGSLLDLTFTTFFKNSNTTSITSLSEGTHLLCQEFVRSKNPLIIYSSELLKNSCSEVVVKALQNLSRLSIRGLGHNRLNVLNSTLSETGCYSTSIIEGFSFKDLRNSRMFYFAHSNLAANSCVKQASEMSLLNTLPFKSRSDASVMDQTYNFDNNIKFAPLKDAYACLQARTFYENDETYCNVEGFFKRTLKLFISKNVLTTWQTILIMLKYLSNHLRPLNSKSFHNLSYNISGYSKFRVFIYLHNYATQNLSNLNFYLISKTSPINVFRLFNFKQARVKIKNCKLKFWLEDFFTGGRDEYSRNSAVLISCSNSLRLASTNF